jgi:hypothetical protein
MSNELRWIRGAGRRPRYVGCGRPWDLYRRIDDLEGTRSTLESIALRTVGRLSPAKEVRSTQIQAAWERLNATIPEISSALLIYTGFFKDTVISGVVESRQPLFVKVFADSTIAAKETARLDALSHIVPADMRLASVVLESNGVIGYELLKRKARRAPVQMLEQAAVELGRKGYHDASTGDSAAWREKIYATRASLAVLGMTLSDHAVSTLEDFTPPGALAHGDFTPWNAFVTYPHELALVDYERVGPRAPFTDFWHLATQQAALGGGKLVPSKLAARACALSGLDTATAFRWYCSYLLEDLSVDTVDWVVHGRQHRQLHRLISAKTRLLKETLVSLES